MPTPRKNPDENPRNSLSPDVQGALEGFGRDFGKLQAKYGNATAALYFWQQPWRVVTRDDYAGPFDLYSGQFDKWLDNNPTISKHWLDLQEPFTPPSLFAAFLYFYLEMLAIGIRSIFPELVKIAPANEADRVAWAKDKGRQIIRDHRPAVRDWVRVACDGPQEDASGWLAPLYLSMHPAGRDRYVPDRAWDYMDAARTENVINSCCDGYEIRLNDEIEDACGDAYKERAVLHPPPQSAEVIEGSGGRGPAPLHPADRRSWGRKVSSRWLIPW